MSQKIDTIIVGAGQGGLATSYYLKKQGREHLVLEQSDQAGSAWRDGRWDSFTLVTPNWTFRLPGAEYNGPHREGFLGRDKVVQIFAGYAERFDLPLRTNCRVDSIEADAVHNERFIVRTRDTVYEARNVVMATGLFQTPKVPAFSPHVAAGVVQLHSASYRNPSQLPDGGVLVVGSSQSGCQIAQEIHQSGRSVTLSVGSAGRIPRSYRGKDIMEWSVLLGVSERTVDTLPSPKAKFAANPHMAGKSEGGSLNLHQFARDGIRLVGRLQDVQGNTATFAPDLHENLAKADKFEADMLQNIDTYIAKAGLKLPEEQMPQLKDGFDVPLTSSLDLEAAGIRSIVWAIGYGFDFSLAKFPILDGDGYPVQKRGVTAQPGLYFVGLPWLHKQKSGLIVGVADDAAHIVDHICSR